MRRVDRLRKQVAATPPERLEVLLDLMEGLRFLLMVKREQYAVRMNPWRFQPMDFSAPEHIVMDDKCTCEDCKYRGRKCKHIEAVSKLEGGVSW